MQIVLKSQSPFSGTPVFWGKQDKYFKMSPAEKFTRRAKR